MIENELNARLQHAVEHTETNNNVATQYPANNSVPLKGEIVFNSTLTDFKVGDGENQYSVLPNFLPTTFSGASALAGGTKGLVPAPAQKASGEADKFLCDDGSWKIVSSSGGTDTHYHTELNGSDYGDTSGVGLGSWYAPTIAGSQYAFLTSNGSGEPNWTLPNNSGFLKYSTASGSAGWSFADVTAATSYYGSLLGQATDGSVAKTVPYLWVTANTGTSISNYAQIALQNGDEITSGSNTYTRLVLGPFENNPVALYTQTSDSASASNGTPVTNKIIHSSGVISAPTGSSGDIKYLKATIGNNNSVTWGWGTPTSVVSMDVDLYGSMNNSTNPPTVTDSDSATHTKRSAITGYTATHLATGKFNVVAGTNVTFDELQDTNNDVSGIVINATGGGSYILPTATSSTLGGLLIEANINSPVIYTNTEDENHISVPIYYTENAYGDLGEKHFVNIYDIVKAVNDDPNLRKALNDALLGEYTPK